MKTCILTVSPSMTEETYEYLCQRARARFGEDLRFEKRTDDVLGGFMMELDGTVYDLTLRTQLERLKSQMTYEEGQT